MEKKRRVIFTLYAYSFMIAFALTGTMFSTALPRIIEDYNLSLSQAGLFSVFTSMGNLGAMAITGIMGDRYRKSILMGSVFIGISISLAFIGMMPPFLLLLCLMVLLGICNSILNLIVTAYVSDLYGEKRAKYINLVHMFYGIGSLIGPLYPMLLQKIGFHWTYSYLFLAVVVFAVGVSYFVVLVKVKEPVTAIKDQNENNRKKEKQYGSLREIFSYKGMFALCIMSFLYMGGHQNTFSTWFQTYLQTENPAVYSVEFTSVCMTLYWIGMVISRTISASVSDKISPRSLILGGSFVGVCILTVGMLFQTPLVWIVTVTILGMCTGAIYPLTYAISCAWFPDSSAKVSSVVGIFTSVGSMTCGWLVGRIANTFSFYFAMLIPWISLGMVFVIVWRYFPKEKKDM